LDAQQFEALKAAGYNRIPLSRELPADLDTPLSIYLKLVDGPYGYLLESVHGGEKWGRHSIIGLPARRRYTVRGTQWTETLDEVVIEQREVADPLAEVEALRERFKVPKLDELPAFTGGLVGYFGHECLAYIEPRLAAVHDKAPALDMPEIQLLLAEEVAVLDRIKGRLFLIVNVDPSEAHAYQRGMRRLDALAYRIRAAAVSYPDFPDPQSIAEADFVSNFPKEAFLAAAARCKDYILAGDVFQVQISQRLSVPFRARPLDVYRALRALNPSPYMYFIDLGDAQIVGASPEILVRVKDGEAVVRPIAGTRRRGRTAAEDLEMEAELLADPKERAEHVMLIDLGRNDIGRIAEPGTVRVNDTMVVERYSHVMHLVSEVVGKLRPGLSFMDVFRATFPAGTLTGAPKVRAAEVIAEMEPSKRGVYGGAVGYLNFHDEADLAIAIRTAVIKDQHLYVQAAAGMVADSVPELEWKETMNKCRALFRAVAEAVRGV
jgi:anthranilate synthase component 1